MPGTKYRELAAFTMRSFLVASYLLDGFTLSYVLFRAMSGYEYSGTRDSSDGYIGYRLVEYSIIAVVTGTPVFHILLVGW